MAITLDKKISMIAYFDNLIVGLYVFNHMSNFMSILYYL